MMNTIDGMHATDDFSEGSAGLRQSAERPHIEMPGDLQEDFGREIKQIRQLHDVSGLCSIL